MTRKKQSLQGAPHEERVITIELDHSDQASVLELKPVLERKHKDFEAYFQTLQEKKLQRLRQLGCPESLIQGLTHHVVNAWVASVERRAFSLGSSNLSVAFWKNAKRVLDVRAYIQEKPMVFLGAWAGSALVLGQLAALGVVAGMYGLYKVSPVWVHPRMVLHTSKVEQDWALAQLSGQDTRDVYRLSPKEWKEAGAWLKEQSEEHLKILTEVLDDVSWFDLMEAEDAKWQQVQQQYEECLAEGLDPLTSQEKDWVYAFGFYEGAIAKIEKGHSELLWRRAKKNVSQGVEKVVENLTKMVLKGKKWLGGSAG